MLIGRKVGQYNQKKIIPGTGSLSITGYAPGVRDFTVLSLNHFDITTGSSAFVDEIPGITWSANPSSGGASVSSVDLHKFGDHSFEVASSASNAWWNGGTFTNPGLGSWTIEGFVFFGSGIDSQNVASLKAGNNASYFNIIGDGNLFFSHTALNHAITLNELTWYHCAIVRDNPGGTYDAFFNGDRIAQKVSASNVTFTSGGVYGSGDVAINWDEFRLSKGVRYSGSTYTPPSAPFP